MMQISRWGGACLCYQGSASFICLLHMQEQQQQLVQGLCRLMEHAGLVAAKAIAATALLCIAEPCVLGAVVQPQLLYQVCLDAQSATIGEPFGDSDCTWSCAMMRQTTK